MEKAPVPKARTYVPGLDDILEGGLPTGRTTLVTGGPGTGKTMLGLQMLWHAARAGEPGVLVNFEEDGAGLRRNATALGWDLEAAERQGTLVVAAPRLDHAAILSGEFDLKGLLAMLDGQTRALGARRVVLDAIDVLLRVFDDHRRERNELLLLNEWLLDRGLTALLTLKADASGPRRYEFLDYAADCVIQLDQRVADQVTTHRLRVLKYRGSGFGKNEYPYLLDALGFRLLPITRMLLTPESEGRTVPSGVRGLDELLGGGFRKGTSILVAGLSGSGKTTLATSFALAACEAGERVAYLSYEDSPSRLLESARSVGIELLPRVQAGELRLEGIVPESMGFESHLDRALRLVDEHRADHLVVDSISASRRMGSERASFDFLIRLINETRAAGRTVLMTNQSSGSQQIYHVTEIGMSSLVDTVIQLRYEDVPGDELARSVRVLKSRAVRHSTRQHGFKITDSGVVLDGHG